MGPSAGVRAAGLWPGGHPLRTAGGWSPRGTSDHSRPAVLPARADRLGPNVARRRDDAGVLVTLAGHDCRPPPRPRAPVPRRWADHARADLAPGRVQYQPLKVRPKSDVHSDGRPWRALPL